MAEPGGDRATGVGGNDRGSDEQGGVTKGGVAKGGDAQGRDDAGWDERARHETPLERLDRNWADLLQELRVIQTGVQLLTGFLLTIPFQARFADLTTFGQVVYLSTLSASVVSTGLLIAPVSLHRLLFRRHARRLTVDTAHRLAQTGLAFLALAIIGMVLLIFDVVAGLAAGIIAAAATVVLLFSLWVALPLTVRNRSEREEHVAG